MMKTIRRMMCELLTYNITSIYTKSNICTLNSTDFLIPNEIGHREFINLPTRLKTDNSTLRLMLYGPNFHMTRSTGTNCFCENCEM